VNVASLWPKTKADLEYGISRGQYFYFKQRARSFSNILFYDPGVIAIGGDGSHAPELAPEAEVSASTFTMLGLKPELGNLFTESDERLPRGAIQPALISHEYWQRRFGGDPQIIGRKIDAQDDGFINVVGVLPPGSALPDVHPDIWLPNHLDPAEAPQNNHPHRGLALLAPNVTLAAANAEILALQDRMQQEYPTVYSPTFLERTGFRMQLEPLGDKIIGPAITRGLWMMFAAVGFVLFIAVANVANLFLVRIDARRREVALRRALGADVSHLAVHYLAESIALSLVAAALGMVLGYVLLRVVLTIAPQSLPRLAEVGFDWRSVAFCVVTSASFGIVFGLLPLGSAGADATMLRDGARGMTSSKAREVARRALVLTQVALAVVLVASAGLMLRTFARMRAANLGFNPTGVHTMQVIVPNTYDNATAATFWHQLTDRLRAVPGITAAAATSSLPMTGMDGCNGMYVDVTSANGEKGNCMPFSLITPGYFEAMGIKAKGKLPTWSDLEAQLGPVVVAKGFSDRFWGERGAVGHGIQPFNDKYPFFPVVAIVDDIRDAGVQAPPTQMSYFPLVAPAGSARWRTGGSLNLVVRAPTLSSSAVSRHVKAILAQLEPKAIITKETSMSEIVAKSMAQTSFTMLLLLISATIALMLSAVGIYGVISYLVGQRRGEIGVRMALGAQTSQVVRLVVGRSLGLAAAGVAIGVAVSVIATRLLRSLLYDVSPNDPLVLAGTVAVLLGVAVLAALAPARRAARIDPVEAMRAAS
jgi:predicted permease